MKYLLDTMPSKEKVQSKLVEDSHSFVGKIQYELGVLIAFMRSKDDVIRAMYEFQKGGPVVMLDFLESEYHKLDDYSRKVIIDGLLLNGDCQKWYELLLVMKKKDKDKKKQLIDEIMSPGALSDILRYSDSNNDELWHKIAKSIIARGTISNSLAGIQNSSDGNQLAHMLLIDHVKDNGNSSECMRAMYYTDDPLTKYMLGHIVVLKGCKSEARGAASYLGMGLPYEGHAMISSGASRFSISSGDQQIDQGVVSLQAMIDVFNHRFPDEQLAS